MEQELREQLASVLEQHASMFAVQSENIEGLLRLAESLAEKVHNLEWRLERLENEKAEGK